MAQTDSLIGADLGGRFRVERRVGDEMLGRVYAARGLDDGRLYYVKVPHASVAGNAEKSERFRRELQATGLLESPHTVRVVDTGIHGEVVFLVMEYLAATPLQKLLDEGALPVSRAASIVAQIARALEAAHQVGIVHRNLSPQTVLLLDNAAEGDFVKVSDFGLSRFTDDQATEAHVLTQAGARIGNVLYMSPEYIEQDEVHAKGDVYALGALLYHLLVGQPPFTGKASDVLTKHVTEDPPRPGLVRRGLPRWTDDLVVALMAKEPEDRPEPAEIVRRLEEGVGHSLRASRLLGVDEEGEVVRPSRAPYLIAAVGAVLMALGGMIFVGAGVLAGGVWAWYHVPALLIPASGDLHPLPDADLPGQASPDPAGEPPAPARPTPRPAPRPGAGDPPPAAPAPSVGSPATAPRTNPAPAPNAAAMLKIRATQRAVIWVDDRVAGYTPIDHGVDPGTHKIVGMLPGKPETRQQRDVVVDASAPTLVEFTF